MDALASLLDAPRAQGAFLLRTLFEPPWAVRIADRAPLSLVTVVSGHATFEGFRLEQGDAAILRGPDPYVFADDPATPIQAVIHPGQRCTTPDPVVGRALRLLHEDPARPWTVAHLAAATGASRAALARRFTELVGEPPMAYLTGWRLALAADLLREPAATIGSVARKVGYGSSFALSTAFKRVRGITPREHRSTAMRLADV